MKSILMSVIVSIVILTLTAPSQAQRRKVATIKTAGEPATVIYKQNFDEENILDNFQEDAEWSDTPGGAFGSLGALKLSGGGKNAERYMKWANNDTTIAFMYYAHGVTEAYIQGRASKAGKNLHAYFKCDKQDEWVAAKIKASSLTGFGGGSSSPGETFRNIIFVADVADKNIDEPFLLIDNIVIFSGTDGQPPSAAPTKLKASWYADANAVSLNWDLAKDDVGIYRYEIHRSESEEFKPARATRIGVVSDNYYEDTTATAGKTYFYRVVGKDMGGFTITSKPVKYSAEKTTTATTPDSTDEF